MPFLRRRGNVASETDMRRHTLFNTPRASLTDEDASVPSDPSVSRSTAPENAVSLSQQPTHDSEPPEHSLEQYADDLERQNKFRRFSILRYRNASDSQLSLRAKQQAETPPPVPRPPAIITTAPTNDFMRPKKATSRMNLAAKFRRSIDAPRDERRSDYGQGNTNKKKDLHDERSGTQEVTSNELANPRPSTQATAISSRASPTASNHRQSESSRSDASSADRVSRASLSTTPKKSHITAPFLKLRRAKKAPEPLFPLAHLPQKTATQGKNLSSASLAVTTNPRPASSRGSTRARDEGVEDTQIPQSSAAATLLVRGGGHYSGQSSPTRVNLLRGRSSTMSSVGRDSTDDHLLPPTTRTSTSTGRKSFGDLFGLGRIRQNSELSRQGTLTPATPGSIGSNSNSLQLPRESVVLPEREDDESPAKYLARIEGVVSRGTIASVLAKGTDAFSGAVLRSYMRSFSFFGDPMDMAIRKLLMEAELPKETQQIDRCLQAFANRYHECNPGIYSSPDQAYFIAFSLLILHTDVFNKNNKHKMQKSDYLKNTRGEGIFDDILECFYDNISYTPFIHVEDDLDLVSERTYSHKSKRKQLLPGNAVDHAKKAAKEPIDPYTLILDGSLDALRPNLKEAMHLDDQYNYLGTATSFNLKDLQNTFFKTGVLQIVSARSRPDAFMSERTAVNPNNAHPGIVDIKVTKVGLLWRKDVKKRKTRSPWQEWGAILTGAQLYFFRNTSWVKNLIHQHENHLKSGHDGIPVIFKPPLEEFKPDALMSTHAAVALIDTAYKKHKNAFVYVRQGGLDEVLLADNEEERNDWLAKLNYAAAFRTSGVRMRGVVGSNYDGQGRRGMRRLDSSDASQLIQTPTGLVSIARGHIDHKMAEDIQAARRDGMQRKIFEAYKKVDECQRQLEEQLRNARHLQILAPIQPRTRDQLLLAAARLSAQLKWTRMDIWREKCHRDILIQDLADDEAILLTTDKQSEQDAATPKPEPLETRLDTKSNCTADVEISPGTPTNRLLSHIPASTVTGQDIFISPTKATLQTSPRSVTKETPHLKSGASTIRHGSVSSIVAPSVQKPSSPTSQQNATGDKDIVIPSRTSDSQYDVDAEERDFLKQAGLWEAKSRRNSFEKPNTSASTDVQEYAPPTERDKLERSKIRRSLQRTLRESAGHLSHHRSKRGREAGVSGAVSPDDVPREIMLSRGTGSFVVHGKKASVINLDTELQTLSQEDKILSRKHSQPLQVEEPLASLLVSDEHDEDFRSALEAPSESNDSNSRRSSFASASTATARSFRQLHRKYSSAQAVRSVSGARLAPPSDGDSEAAFSSSDGRQSFQEAAEIDSEGGLEKSDSNGESPPVLDERTRMLGQPEEDNNSEDLETNSQQEHDALPSRSVPAVTV
ncbi:hypothetical protein QQS21_001027 [Conoideocrella luteorostrata]|uniref:Guanyl-nucleotide exchange factor n=1 Tax=Conoideocrella luteorostrata TaxID=1105319 RepID=A0AAJ0G3N0_9HYPO|nr:hypothetical protein QQS21_001027 [Conoideocrella luteorostrata]